MHKKEKTSWTPPAALSLLTVSQVCELGELLEQDKSRCEGLVRQDRQEVNQFFQSLEMALAKKRQAYLEALDKAGAEVSRAYEPLINRVKELQVCLSLTLFLFVPLTP